MDAAARLQCRYDVVSHITPEIEFDSVALSAATVADQQIAIDGDEGIDDTFVS